VGGFWGGAVGIATCYALDGLGFAPAGWGEGGKTFSVLHSCPYRPWVHPVPFTRVTGTFPGVKRPGHGVGTHPHLAPWLTMSRAITVPAWHVTVRLCRTLCGIVLRSSWKV
jgi:hypothetical protein